MHCFVWDTCAIASKGRFSKFIVSIFDPVDRIPIVERVRWLEIYSRRGSTRWITILFVLIFSFRTWRERRVSSENWKNILLSNMRNRTVALLIILQVIRAHSTSPSSTTNRSNEMVDENIACTVRNHEEATMMSSLVRMNRSRNEESEMYAQQRAYNDCATNAMFGKFSSGAQCCTKEKRIEPIKNLGKIF